MKKFRLTYNARCAIRKYLKDINISPGKYFEIVGAQAVKNNVVISITIVTISLKGEDIDSNVLKVYIPIERRKLLRFIRKYHSPTPVPIKTFGETETETRLLECWR